MPVCPNCHEEIPLLVKICPICKRPVSDEEAGRAEKMVNELEEVLLRLKSIPRPTFIKSLSKLTYILFPILAVYLLVLALMSDARIFWATGGLTALLSIYSIIRRALGKLGNDPVQAEFLQLKNTHELLHEKLMSRYGKDDSVRSRVAAISNEVAAVEAAHGQANRHNLYKWIGVSVVCALLATGGAFTVDKRVSEVETAQTPATEEDWKAVIAEFKTSSANDEFADNTGRMELLNRMLDADRVEVAERFFFECCQGKVGDFDCAQAVMRYHIDEAQNPEAAMKFANKVLLRYGSDMKRLKQILND